MTKTRHLATYAAVAAKQVAISSIAILYGYVALVCIALAGG